MNQAPEGQRVYAEAHREGRTTRMPVYFNARGHPTMLEWAEYVETWSSIGWWLRRREVGEEPVTYQVIDQRTGNAVTFILDE